MTAARRTETAGVVRLRRLFAAVAILIVVAVVVGISRIDIGDTISELTLPLRHDDIIRQQAREKGVPADLIAAVIYEESKFEDQTSSAGARGLMQITPDTADTIEKLSGGETFVYEDLADPELNIRYGTYFLRYLLDRYDGDVVAALAAYNAGIGNADAWGGAGMELGDIEFPETYDYVKDVLERRREYRHKYAEELGF
ncbi:MAG: lytic transglycosylase domain-containing protein [Solirubrobacterales bacterium]